MNSMLHVYFLLSVMSYWMIKIWTLNLWNLAEEDFLYHNYSLIFKMYHTQTHSYYSTRITINWANTKSLFPEIRYHYDESIFLYRLLLIVLVLKCYILYHCWTKKNPHYWLFFNSFEFFMLRPSSFFQSSLDDSQIEF